MVGEWVVVRATVIKIARAIIILKPAFLAAWSLDRSRRRFWQWVKKRRRNGWERVGRERGEGGGWVARRKWKEEEGKGERGGEDEKGGRGNRGCRWVLCTRWGLKFGDGTGGGGGEERWWTSKRRAEGGGSFISLPHGIIYREDFRESTQRAPR